MVELAGEGFEGGGRDFASGAAEEFLFYGVEATGDVGEFLGDLRVECGQLRVESRGPLGGDFGLGLAVPFDQGGFGDAEPAADRGEAEALGAEAEEVGASGNG